MFKINISDKGKTFKLETESEVIVGKKIGETIKGEDISADLDGYELEITGTSDISGIPGFKGLEGTAYHRRLLKYGPGMHDKRKGIRLRKTHRGEEISLKTSQINLKVIKEGSKKFDELLIPKTEGGDKEKEKTQEETQTTDTPSEKPVTDTDKKEEKPEEAPAEKPAEKPAQ